MTTPLAVLVLYALWTVFVLLAGVATARTKRVMNGEKFSDFPGGVAEGPPYHQRAMRAHLNCVENLPVYAAVAITAAIAGVTGPVISGLAIAVLIARIAQSSLHLSFEQTEPVVRVRGSLFGIQIFAIVWMAIIVLIYA
ncbi:MAG: MAPEG family protein [Methyloligella sp. ZOD6]